MMKILHFTLVVGVIASQMIPVELYSQDNYLPQSWVTCPSPDKIHAYIIEPGSLKQSVTMNPDGNPVYMPKSNKEGVVKILMEDPMTGDWRENWFLDGKEATLTNTENGLFFSGGTVTKNDDPEEYHAHHAVLWTKKEFEGNIKISFEMTRLDNSDYGTTLLYIQASGIGTPPYVEDISAWNDLREIPNMATYYTYMDLLSLSFRENLRCKRYPWRNENLEWYPGKGLIEPMVEYNYEKILPGKTYLVEIEKRAASLQLRLVEKESLKLMIDHTWNTDNIAEGVEPKQIQKGRIGLRHMATRQYIYRNFKVETLVSGEAGANNMKGSRTNSAHIESIVRADR